MPPKLTNQIITAAIDGFEAQKTRIDAKIAELRALLPGGSAETTAATSEPATPKRRKMSAAARKRIGDAQRKRWAESKKSEAPATAPAKTAPAKKKMSRARKAALLANFAKARSARAAKRAAA
jgi:hypothetical protein